MVIHQITKTYHQQFGIKGFGDIRIRPTLKSLYPLFIQRTSGCLLYTSLPLLNIQMDGMIHLCYLYEAFLFKMCIRDSIKAVPAPYPLRTFFV